MHVLVSRNDDASADVALGEEEKEGEKKVIGEVNFVTAATVVVVFGGLFACLFLSL